MTSFYLEWLKTKFIQEFRAPASKASTISDTTVKTTIYLWSIIQVHRVMKEIRDFHFQGHPSVAPIINLHMFKTCITATTFTKVGANKLVINKSFWTN